MIARMTALALFALNLPAQPLFGLPSLQPADERAGAHQVSDDRDSQPADKDIAIGRYYLNKRDYFAALNRLKLVVIENHAGPQAEEALAGLTESYLALGIAREAQTAVAVLGRNFPDSPCYAKSYDLLNSAGLEPIEDEDSWMTRAFR